MASIDICLRLKDEFNLINTNSKFNFTFNNFSYCDNYYAATVLHPSCINNMVHVATNCYINTYGKLICTRLVESNYNEAYHYLSILYPKVIKDLEVYKKDIILEKIKQLNKDFI